MHVGCTVVTAVQAVQGRNDMRKAAGYQRPSVWTILWSPMCGHAFTSLSWNVYIEYE